MASGACIRCKKSIDEDQGFIQFGCKQKHRFHLICLNSNQTVPQLCLECSVFSTSKPAENKKSVVRGVYDDDDGFSVDDAEPVIERNVETPSITRKPLNTGSSPLFFNMSSLPTSTSSLSATPSIPFSMNTMHNSAQYQPEQLQQLQLDNQFHQLQLQNVQQQVQLPQQPFVTPLSTFQTSSSLTFDANSLLRGIPYLPSSSWQQYSLYPSISIQQQFSSTTQPPFPEMQGLVLPKITEENRFVHQSSPRQFWVTVREDTTDAVSIESDPRMWLKQKTPYIGKLQSKRYFYQMFAAAGVTRKLWLSLNYKEADINGFKSWSAQQSEIPPGSLDTKFYDNIE
jgi:hypothetical protein